MRYKLLKREEEKRRVEDLRRELSHLKSTSDYYLDRLLNNQMYAMGAYNENELIGVVYFHKMFEDILEIDKLFVIPEYAESNLRDLMISKILQSKERFENIVGEPLVKCVVETESRFEKVVYSRQGFVPTALDNSVLSNKFIK